MTLTVNFGDVTKAKNVKADIDEEENELEKQERLKREEDAFEKIMKKQREKMSKVDFVSKNMELTQMDQIDREREKIFKIRTVY